MHIARRFLFPKQLGVNGLDGGEDKVRITDDALKSIATRYTREAGVRGLERTIGAVVRFKAVEWARSSSAGEGGEGAAYNSVVEEGELEGILGIARWDEREGGREERRGVVYGLVVSGLGEGAVMPVESVSVPGTGKLVCTGSLGDVSPSPLPPTSLPNAVVCARMPGDKRISDARADVPQVARVHAVCDVDAVAGRAQVP
jgi:ATP-dependent Lon protease